MLFSDLYRTYEAWVLADVKAAFDAGMLPRIKEYAAQYGQDWLDVLDELKDTFRLKHL